MGCLASIFSRHKHKEAKSPKISTQADLPNLSKNHSVSQRTDRINEHSSRSVSDNQIDISQLNIDNMMNEFNENPSSI